MEDGQKVISLEVSSGGWRTTNDLLCPTPECTKYSTVLAYETVLWQNKRYLNRGYLFTAQVHAHHCEDCRFTAYEVDVSDEIDLRFNEILIQIGLKLP